MQFERRNRAQRILAGIVLAFTALIAWAFRRTKPKTTTPPPRQVVLIW